MIFSLSKFQHTAARRRLVFQPAGAVKKGTVSTHSRPKAAGHALRVLPVPMPAFQHTAARRRLGSLSNISIMQWVVSTHSRPKAAGALNPIYIKTMEVSTHSRPKAAGASLKSLAPSGFAAPISLNSQEKREREYNTALSVTPAFAIS